MRLCPDEARVNELDLLQPLELLQANGQQLTGLEGTLDPLAGRLQVALAIATKLECGLLRDVLRDVDVCPEAAHAHVCWIGFDGDSAFAAEAEMDRI